MVATKQVGAYSTAVLEYEMKGWGALSQSRAGEQLYGFMSRDPPERWPRQGGFDQSLWQPGGALELGGNGLAADGLATPLWHMAFDDLRAVECEPGGDVSFCEAIGGRRAQSHPAEYENQLMVANTACEVSRKHF